MEIRIDQRSLLQMLYRAQGIVDKKSTLNVLAHVLIESVGKDAVRVSCTDYDVALVAVYPAEVIEPGAMAVNGKNVFDVVKSLPHSEVSLKTRENHWVDLSCGRSAFKLAGIPPADFPEQKDPEELPGINVDRRTLLDMIDKTIFSVSNDETRMNLNGVYFQAEAADAGEKPSAGQPELEGDNDIAADAVKISMVSTDGHRLSRSVKIVPTADPLEKPMDAIVHRKGVQEVRRILEGEDETVTIYSHENNMVFRYENAVLFVRQIEDSFPEYGKVIPKSSAINVHLDKQELLDGIRRTATLTSAKVSVVRMGFEEGSIVLTTNNPEYGEARVEVDADYSGESLTAGFNYRYMQDVLSVIQGDVVTFRINDEFSPGLIESDDDPGSSFVIMPMRI